MADLSFACLLLRSIFLAPSLSKVSEPERFLADCNVFGVCCVTDLVFPKKRQERKQKIQNAFCWAFKCAKMKTPCYKPINVNTKLYNPSCQGNIFTFF